jgi:hypothetical protein
MKVYFETNERLCGYLKILSGDFFWTFFFKHFFEELRLKIAPTVERLKPLLKIVFLGSRLRIWKTGLIRTKKLQLHVE